MLGSIAKIPMAGATGLESETYRNFDAGSTARPNANGETVAVYVDFRKPVERSNLNDSSCEFGPGGTENVST